MPELVKSQIRDIPDFPKAQEWSQGYNYSH